MMKHSSAVVNRTTYADPNTNTIEQNNCIFHEYQVNAE